MSIGIVLLVNWKNSIHSISIRREIKKVRNALHLTIEVRKFHFFTPSHKDVTNALVVDNSIQNLVVLFLFSKCKPARWQAVFLMGYWRWLRKSLYNVIVINICVLPAMNYLSPSHLYAHVILAYVQTDEAGTIIMPSFQMRKLRVREVK